MILVAVALALFSGAGCGGNDSAESVVREWTDAVSRGENDRAADFFAAYATVIQGRQTLTLATHDEAVAWNAGLPCAATIVSIVEQDGERVRATFLLEDRASTPCDGPGAEVGVEFVVRDGRIAVLRQLGGSPAATMELTG